MKIKITILCILFIISFCWIAYSKSAPHPNQANDAITKFATIDVLVVFYTNAAGTEISDSDIARLKNGIQLAREFIWRNSACHLNLNINYLEIDEKKPEDFFPDHGLPFPNVVENDFNNYDIQPNQYGIIFLIYSSPKGGGNFGGMKILGETGYSFCLFPCRTSALFPGENSEVNYRATWLFTHEIQLSIDLICYEYSDAPEMWDGDRPLDYSKQSGEFFSYQAEIFRNFNKYLKIESPWGKIEQAIDKDQDKFPDNDPRIPIDELRFGSDDTNQDTDNDGLNDLQEFMLGIYKGSDPKNNDTDNDGKIDGKDIFPLHNINPHVPKITPSMDDKWDSWYLISEDLDFSKENFLVDAPLKAEIYMCWDNDFLYFGCEMDAPVNLHLDIDFLSNGWWHGNDNYRLVTDPFSKRFNDIHVMDATKSTREFRNSLGKGSYEMWDDEPEYRAKFGKIVDESSIELFTKAYEDRYIIKIKIPNNDRVPFQLGENKKLGMRIYFISQEIGATKTWATVYEQYEFFQITLK